MRILKKTWRESEKVTAWAALLLSLVAVIISVKSCRQADHAQNLAEKEFASKRHIILRGSYEKESEKLKISPLDASIAIQSAEVIFPPQIDKSTHIVRAPDYTILLSILKGNLQRTIEKLMPKKIMLPNSRIEGFPMMGGVPIIITTNYVTQGELFIERSLYHVTFDFVIDSKSFELSFGGINFVRRLNLDDDPREILKEEWKVNTDSQ